MFDPAVMKPFGTWGTIPLNEGRLQVVDIGAIYDEPSGLRKSPYS